MEMRAHFQNERKKNRHTHAATTPTTGVCMDENLNILFYDGFIQGDNKFYYTLLYNVQFSIVTWAWRANRPAEAHHLLAFYEGSGYKWALKSVQSIMKWHLNCEISKRRPTKRKKNSIKHNKRATHTRLQHGTHASFASPVQWMVATQGNATHKINQRGEILSLCVTQWPNNIKYFKWIRTTEQVAGIEHKSMRCQCEMWYNHFQKRWLTTANHVHLSSHFA